jgi:2-amino-4-hydroxy-6-hydroxymethyldihydropteridine diphosphokinase
VATEPVQARVFVGLGSNLCHPADQVMRALGSLDALPEVQVLRRSHLYRSAPWGVLEQPPFVNAVAELRTALAPRVLLDALLAIERGQGRRRDGERWGPRLIDLDLLCFGSVQIDEPGLVVPHPRIAERAFVLMPLAEIAPDFSIPGAGVVSSLLADVDVRDCAPIE